MAERPSSDAAVPSLFAPARAVAVLLPLPLAGSYDYAVPDGLQVAPGDVVLVPLGSREVWGVVWGEAEGIEARRLKPILEVLAPDALPEISRRFVDWVSNYTLAPKGPVMRMAISVSSALEPEKPVLALRRTTLSAETVRMTPARLRVLEAAVMALPPGDLARAAGVGSGVVKGLVDAGLLESVALPRRPWPRPDPETPGPALSRAQESASAALRASVAAADFQVTLLDGVTGAGKTEVYLEAIAEALRQGRQSLVLLPEIALSQQWLERFKRRFGVPPVAWHSELTGRQRRMAWRAVRSGEAAVVVGARSALFLPYADLGLIVVDEEHEAAFKQEEGVIYHARDMAVVRASLGKLPVVLVSATPSLETLANVESGRYAVQHLPSRHGGASLPKAQLVDLRRAPPERLSTGEPGWLSPPLRTAITETLAAGEQALLFLNRRGYAPLTLCRACGFRLQCPNCTAWLVEHRLLRRLQCHHCGHQVPLPSSCPSCGVEGKLAPVGPGVERLAEEAALLFPDARRAIFSSDAIAGPQALAAAVAAIEERKVDLLIGTQIVAKGHHFPHLTLVGVVDGDLGLIGGDLRAGERTFQLISQVAGRAGRAERAGRVLIQTADPEHAVMQALGALDREAFLEAERAGRRKQGLPPYGRLVALILASHDPELVDSAAQALARNAPRGKGVQVLGPAPAPLAVLRGRHRRRFLMKTRKDLLPQPLVRAWIDSVKLPAAVRLAVDVDPYSFL